MMNHLIVIITEITESSFSSIFQKNKFMAFYFEENFEEIT